MPSTTVRCHRCAWHASVARRSSNLAITSQVTASTCITKHPKSTTCCLAILGRLSDDRSGGLFAHTYPAMRSTAALITGHGICSTCPSTASPNHPWTIPVMPSTTVRCHRCAWHASVARRSSNLAITSQVTASTCITKHPKSTTCCLAILGRLSDDRTHTVLKCGGICRSLSWLVCWLICWLICWFCSWCGGWCRGWFCSWFCSWCRSW